MASTVRPVAALLASLIAAWTALPARAGLWASSSGNTPGVVTLGEVNPAVGTASASFTIAGGGGSGTMDLAGNPLWQGAALWGVRTSASGTRSLAAWNPISRTFIKEVVLGTMSDVRTLAIDPTDGRFYATTDTALYAIDSNDGIMTLIGPTAGIREALGFDGSGQLYGLNAVGRLLAVNKSTGGITEVGLAGPVVDIAWDAQAGRMLAIGPQAGSYALYQIDLSSAALTRLGPSFSRPSGLAFTGLAADFNGSLMVEAADLDIWQTHAGMTAGATATQGDANRDGAVNGIDFLAWQRQFGSSVIPPPAVAVPEPGGPTLGTIILATCCAACFKALRWRPLTARLA